MILLDRLIACSKVTTRSAFSLLELMLALGLLGALLAVAWSLLGTYRNAEVRGWKLSHRVQTVRTARAWLESDAQHLSMTHRFTGNAMGYTATIAPSIDPIPFLENLMSDATQADRELPELDSLLGGEDNTNTASTSPWPAESIDIEYRLTPMASSSTLSESRSVNAGLGSEMDDTQYVLTRYEVIASQSQTTDANPSERILSTQDLYRQTDENLLDSSPSYRESRLEGLTKVQFRYFDGSSWKSNWNSDQQGGLPRAIAFGFDFPAASEIQPPSTENAEPTDEEGLMSDQLQTMDLPFAESTLAAEPVVESSTASSPAIMESSTSEVQIVVSVPNGIFKIPAAATILMQRVRP